MAERRNPSLGAREVSSRRRARGVAARGAQADARRASVEESAGSGMDAARGGVPEIQRARIVTALVEVARERGAGRVTVAHIVARSGVSRRTFYEMFGDRDACFLAAFETAIERGAARVLPAFEQRGRWQERLRGALLGLLEFLDDEPGLGGLCVVDTLGAGPAALERRAQIVAVLVDAIDQGRGQAKAGLSPSRLTAEGVVGGVLAVLYARLAVDGAAATRPQSLVDLLNPLMGTIVLPYLGPGAAARELARAAPQARGRVRRPRSNPLEGLDMRLTYRTVRVLRTIASRPGSSNRQVADAAGIQDQGQISKLLTRLEHLGLIENVGSGATRGEPNAWRLTARGHEVELTIRQQTAPVRS